MSSLNAGVGGLGGIAQTAVAVVAMAGAGLLMMGWRRLGGHVVTPALAHVATNSLGMLLLAAWLVSG